MEEVMLAGVSSAKRTEMIEILRQAIRNLRDFPERD
jgi:hypothetical protein